jgi:hypothetical protein
MTTQHGGARMRIMSAVAVVAGLGLAASAILAAAPASASSLPVMYGSNGWHDGKVRPSAVRMGLAATCSCGRSTGAAGE